MNAVDTNILTYVYDPHEPVKRATAASLVHSARGAILIRDLIRPANEVSMNAMVDRRC